MLSAVRRMWNSTIMHLFFISVDFIIQIYRNALPL